MMPRYRLDESRAALSIPANVQSALQGNRIISKVLQRNVVGTHKARSQGSSKERARGVNPGSASSSRVGPTVFYTVWRYGSRACRLPYRNTLSSHSAEDWVALGIETGLCPRQRSCPASKAIAASCNGFCPWLLSICLAGQVAANRSVLRRCSPSLFWTWRNKQATAITC